MRMTPTDPSEPLEAPSRARHTAGQKAVLALNLGVVLACVVGAVALLYGKNQLDGRLQTDRFDAAATPTSSPVADASSTVAPGPTATFPAADPQARNFLITGSDANACNDPGSPWAGATTGREGFGSRSDTIMVMRVDPTTNAAAVLSFPRDLWVQIPGKGKNRINTAYVENDYTQLAQTLWDNWQIPVDHYVQVDFCAFKRIVEAVGGVGVPFEHPVVDANIGLDVKPQPGESFPFCHVFSGDEALAYVRSRHLKWVDENGVKHEDAFADLGRITRQQDFLRRTLQHALDKGLFDPTVAKALVESLQTDIVTEAGFTVDDMLRFAGVMKNVATDTIRTYQIETYGKVIGGNSVLLQSSADINAQVLAIFQGVAPLAGAPVQDLTSTTVAAGTAGVTTTTVATGPAVTNPVDSNIGQIIPPKNVSC